MIGFVRGILHPEAFHGQRAATPFFEGWYLKLVTADGSRSLAIIPGVFRGRPDGSAHAFIQVVDPDAAWVRYERFSPQEFSGASDAFDVTIDGHRFAAEGIQLSLPGCSGHVRFGELSPWPVSPRSPGVMGWYAWMPIMQCYHGIVSLNHSLHGSLEVNGERLDFEGGRGYIEKDWGRSFPKRWVWMQSNHFEEAEVCVTVSIADVPWFGGAFPGFLVGFLRGGQLLRFTTYTGARVTRVEPLERGALFEVESADHRLTAIARGGRALAIHMPSEDSMRGVVREHLDATIEVQLSEQGRGGKVLFEGVGFQAAYEVQGDISRLRRRSPFSRDSAS